MIKSSFSAYLLLCLLSLVCLSSSFSLSITSGKVQRSISHLTMSLEEMMFPSTFTLTSSAAEKAMDAACQEADANGWSVTVAISDAGGVPILVKRCETFPASYEIAVGKAKTAARERNYCNVIHMIHHLLYISYLLLCFSKQSSKNLHRRWKVLQTYQMEVAEQRYSRHLTF